MWFGGIEINRDEKIRLLQAREYIVAKSNEVVQKSRYELSVQEQKTIAYICSMIKPISAIDRANKVPFILEYEFNIRDYCHICGIDYDNGNNYREIKSTLKGLRDKSFWLMLEEGTETTISWLSKVWCNKGTGKVQVRLDEDMTPYLFDLQEKFISYGLQTVLAMKSQYSIRLYELLKSYAYHSSKTFEIDEMKRLLMVENNKSYKNFFDFNKRVLEPAQKEINEYTDINISYRPIKKGNKVARLEFRMKEKTSEERYYSYAAVEEKIGDMEYDQLCLNGTF